MTAQQRLGDRLRRIRHQQDLSLADVEERSHGEWKGVVVGAYERGDRAITIARLARLAEFYQVPLADLLPAERSGSPAEGGDHGSVRLDLARLRRQTTSRRAEGSDRPADSHAGTLAAVARFADRIRATRGDHNGRVLTVRADDLALLALAIGEDRDELLELLRHRRVLLSE